MAEIKRPNYFTGQLLVENDFKDEQSYHSRLRRLHNYAIFNWGVVKGLNISIDNPSNLTFAITPGLAIDKYGREIIVQETLKWVAEPGDSREFYIGISYQERKTDFYTGEISNTATRIVEEVEFKLLPINSSPTIDPTIKLEQSLLANPPSDDQKAEATVVLAKVTMVNGKVNSIDHSFRQSATINAASLNVKADNGAVGLLIGTDTSGGIVSTLTNHDLKLAAGTNSVTIKKSGNVEVAANLVGSSIQLSGSIKTPMWNVQQVYTLYRNPPKPKPIPK
ncbi:MAG: hypothetical protein AB1489_20130, partial [Acidobacteriota bacterium]